MGVVIQFPKSGSGRSGGSEKGPGLLRTAPRASRGRVLRVVASSSAGLFIPFVLGVLLTVDRAASARTCVASRRYSALMSHLAPGGGGRGAAGAVMRVGASVLQAVAPLVIALVVFVVLCWLLQLPVLTYIGLKKGPLDLDSALGFHMLIVFATPMSLVLVLQHAGFISQLQGCELPALRTSWIPWAPAEWFRTGMSWLLFAVSTFVLTVIASVLPGRGPLLLKEEDLD